ncbi:hypothetical protein DFH09DRAFT_1085155 [Mycena vulgaris]|nr:hypothetical protein DFH09DRAFT_1085155 [Mycena vulgaris]
MLLLLLLLKCYCNARFVDIDSICTSEREPRNESFAVQLQCRRAAGRNQDHYHPAGWKEECCEDKDKPSPAQRVPSQIQIQMQLPTGAWNQCCAWHTDKAAQARVHCLPTSGYLCMWAAPLVGWIPRRGHFGDASGSFNAGSYINGKTKQVIVKGRDHLHPRAASIDERSSAFDHPFSNEKDREQRLFDRTGKASLDYRASQWVIRVRRWVLTASRASHVLRARERTTREGKPHTKEGNPPAAGPLDLIALESGGPPPIEPLQEYPQIFAGTVGDSRARGGGATAVGAVVMISIITKADPVLVPRAGVSRTACR